METAGEGDGGLTVSRRYTCRNTLRLDSALAESRVGDVIVPGSQMHSIALYIDRFFLLPFFALYSFHCQCSDVLLLCCALAINSVLLIACV